MHPSSDPAAAGAAVTPPVSRVVLGLLAVALAAAGCTGRDGAEATASGSGYIAGSGTVRQYAPADRRAVPEVSSRTLDGAAVGLDDYRGRVLVLNFWASWCPPCRAESKALAQAARDTRASGVAFLGINFKEDASQARIFSERQRTPYPSLVDKYGEITIRFSPSVPPQSIPTTLVVDRRGRIAASVFGEITYTRLLPLLRAVAAERPA